MADAGNYTCVASNDFITRKSQEAEITVYVPGSWSSWGDWSECNTKCGRGLRERKRSCSSPAPIDNNGKHNKVLFHYLFQPPKMCYLYIMLYTIL
jgi:hypothetical protein